MDVEERLGRLEKRLRRAHNELQGFGVGTFVVLFLVGWMVIDGHADEMEMLVGICVQVECPREVFDD